MKHFRLPALILAVLVLPLSALAEDCLILPVMTGIIEDGAFAGDTGIDTLIVPTSLCSVGSGAFAGCAGLDIAEFSESEAVIGTDAFAGCGSALLIRAAYGTPAHRYAQENGIDYQAGTAYRALLIGNWDYPGTGSDLEGPRYDVEDMSAALSGLPGTPWSCTTRMNLKARAIPSAITSAFSGATDADVSLVYYSGHGSVSTGGSCLVGTDLSPCYASDLRAALDRIPGRKILIIDACDSGGLIPGEVVTADGAEGAGQEAEASAAAADFVSGMLSPFRRQSRDGTLAGSLYFVMAAAAAD